jgi:hypothetical protein
MKTTHKLIAITGLFIASGFLCTTKAQLASEKPVAAILTPAMKAKLAAMPNNNRTAMQPARLASARGIPLLPAAVSAKIQPPQAGMRTATSGEVKKQQLASNQPAADVNKLVNQKLKSRRNLKL